MKRLFTILILLACLIQAGALTPFYLVSLNPDGSANTNQVILATYPPGKPFYIYGTNIVTGFNPITNTPNSGGFFSNSLLPLTYTVTYANSPSSQPGYFVSITDTTNYLPLITYVTAVPVVSASFGTQFGLVTNWLGYWPATNTPAGIQAAVGFVIATNGGFVSLGQITAGLGYTPPTNSIAGLNFVYGLPPAAVPATNTDPRIVFAVTNTTALWGTNVMLVRLLTPGLSLTNSYTTNSDNSVTLNIGMAFQAATNVLTRMTSSNPTNSYATGTLYTNGNFKSFLTGYATGGILNYTNNATAYILPLTNDFCVPLTTNTTFSIIGGTVTNVVNWQ